MKKIILLVTFILMLLVAAACSSAGNEGGTAAPGITLSATEGAGGFSSTESALGGTETFTGTMGTSAVETPMGTATQAVSTTEQPTAAATQSVTATQAVSPTQSGSLSATQVVTGTAQLPGTGKGSANRLSTFFGMTVVNQNGEILGTTNDYILNLCESHILYIVLRPTSSFGFASGEYILIPYEAVSVNNGQFQSDQRRIMVNVSPEEMKLAPTFTQADLDLSNPGWEAEAMSYWSNTFRTSLTSECKVTAPNLSGQPNTAGTPAATVQVTGTVTSTTSTTNTQTTPAATQGLVSVYHIVYARDVLAAQVQDGNGAPLGQVEDVLVNTQTGRLDFVAVRLDDSQTPDAKLVLVPLRALNLLEPGARPVVLVLLVETNILQNAPAINDLATDASQGAGADVFDYWSQYVQMTREGE